ncbi:MAG: ATP-binding cassette domain-containing protein [Pseudomonadota bacterium]
MSRNGVLEVQDLAGGYGEITVVRGLSLSVKQGQAVFLTGRNGVGKSTLAKLVAGHLPATAGTIRFDGKDFTSQPDHARRPAGLGYAPQESTVFDTLSILENLTLPYDDRDLSRYNELFLLFPRIKDRLTQLAGTLSGGEKKILSFCRAIGEETRLVVMDEPSEGVQPENIDRMGAMLEQEKTRGRSFLIVEQNLTLVEHVADHAYLLDHGECVFETQRSPNMRQMLSDRLNL